MGFGFLVMRNYIFSFPSHAVPQSVYGKGKGNQRYEFKDKQFKSNLSKLERLEWSDIFSVSRYDIQYSLAENSWAAEMNYEGCEGERDLRVVVCPDVWSEECRGSESWYAVL
jgi:hypothetical protein